MLLSFSSLRPLPSDLCVLCVKSFLFVFSFAVIPTGVAGIFFRAVPGAPATQRRDHGNQRSTKKPVEITAYLYASCYLFALV